MLRLVLFWRGTRDRSASQLVTFTSGADYMSIKEWRTAIDEIDSELLRLLNTRAQLAVRVGESKKASGISVCDRDRELEVIERARAGNQGPLDDAAIVKLFRRIIRESRRVEAQAMERSNAPAKRTNS
jgi:chorismate mutase